MANEANPADGFDPNPRASRGFGPAEAADAARQAQFTESDDTPTDVNLNAIIARSQALTVDVLGKIYGKYA